MDNKLIIGLCVIGLAIAFTALYYHYDDSGSKFCDVNAKFSCTSVYKSDWSYLFGIPVPILGIFGYAAFGLLVWFRKNWAKVLDFTDRDSWWYLALIATAMFLYQTFMTSLELIGVIPAICILCLGSQVVVTFLAFLSWRKFRETI